jgi:hypothetical protein
MNSQNNETLTKLMEQGLQIKSPQWAGQRPDDVSTLDKGCPYGASQSAWLPLASPLPRATGEVRRSDEQVRPGWRGEACRAARQASLLYFVFEAVLARWTSSRVHWV